MGTAGTPFADGIDAALGHKGNNSVYFFKGEDYVKFADGSSTMATNYPRAIAGRWPGLAEALGRVDAAFWRDSIERIYFFKNSRFGAKYVRVTPDDFTVEPDYADGKSYVGLSKNDAEALWRNPALEQLGYDGSHNGGRQLCADLVAETNADQGIVIYVTKLPAVHHAYAGGYRVTLSKRDYSGNLSRVLTHEMLHLFGAPDEYLENSSCTKKHGRFLQATNSNSRACATTSVNCIMDGDQPPDVQRHAAAHRVGSVRDPDRRGRVPRGHRQDLSLQQRVVRPLLRHQPRNRRGVPVADGQRIHRSERGLPGRNRRCILARGQRGDVYVQGQPVREV